MSKKKENTIVLNGDDGDVEVEVIDQTDIDGTKYLLVADVTDDEEDSDCYILKDVSKNGSTDANYEVVADDEADAIFEEFGKKLKGDIDLEK